MRPERRMSRLAEIRLTAENWSCQTYRSTCIPPLPNSTSRRSEDGSDNLARFPTSDFRHRTSAFVCRSATATLFQAIRGVLPTAIFRPVDCGVLVAPTCLAGVRRRRKRGKGGWTVDCLVRKRLSFNTRKPNQTKSPGGGAPNYTRLSRLRFSLTGIENAPKNLGTKGAASPLIPVHSITYVTEGLAL
jgi:hypothetical protein